jgi:hypothetical protein
MPARRSKGYDVARRRLIAARYVRSDAPRIRVRLPRDPMVCTSVLAFALGGALILARLLLDPVDRIHPEGPAGSRTTQRPT